MYTFRVVRPEGSGHKATGGLLYVLQMKLWCKLCCTFPSKTIIPHLLMQLAQPLSFGLLRNERSEDLAPLGI